MTQSMGNPQPVGGNTPFQAVADLLNQRNGTWGVTEAQARNVLAAIPDGWAKIDGEWVQITSDGVGYGEFDRAHPGRSPRAHLVQCCGPTPVGCKCPCWCHSGRSVAASTCRCGCHNGTASHVGPCSCERSGLLDSGRFPRAHLVQCCGPTPVGCKCPCWCHSGRSPHGGAE